MLIVIRLSVVKLIVVAPLNESILFIHRVFKKNFRIKTIIFFLLIENKHKIAIWHFENSTLIL